MKIKSEKKKHWNKFYKTFALNSESNFSRFIIKWFKKNKYKTVDKTLIDIGCGNSRDAKYFKSKDIAVTGIDQSSIAIELNKKNYVYIDYFKKDICKKKFEFNRKKFDYLYARFFIHAISLRDESQFLNNCKKISKKDSIFLFEFRTTHDPLINKGTKLKGNERFYGHYRRFVDINQFIKKIEIYGFKILYISQGKNYANFKKEQPHICRMILKKKN